MMGMISIAICDDDSNVRSFIKNETIQIMESYGASGIFADFPDAASCLQQLESGTFDLLFLDIEMPEMDGFALAEKLQEGDHEISIIFVSSHENLVFDSYKYDALWFVRKSSLGIDLDRAVKKFLERSVYNQLYYTVRDNAGVCRLLYKNILYFECSAHIISVMTRDRTYKMTGSLKKLEEELEPCHFVRVHKSFLVNLRHIYAINSDTVTLSDNSTIPLSKERRSEVRKLFFSRGERDMG